MEWLNAIIQGVLLGGLYALFAAGLSLIFGVMRVVNLAHGDFIILAAYLAFAIIQATGMGPLETLVLVVPVMALGGYLLQRGLLNLTLDRGILPPVLVTFGLSIIIQNGLQEAFSADSRGLSGGAIGTAAIHLVGPISIGVLPLAIFLVAIAVIVGLQLLFSRTALGRDFRATSDDQTVAQLMGIDNRHLYGLAVALAFAIIAVAGVMLGLRTTFSPDIGPGRLIFAFEAVIIGGLGSLWGTLVGGVILGTAHTVGAQIDPALRELLGHIIFLLVLLVRPSGLFPRTKGM